VFDLFVRFLPLQPSSPSQDDGEGLARLSIGAMHVGGALTSEGLNEVVFSLKSLTLTDIRPHSDLAVKRWKRIFNC
jgi:hypothetical protein